MSTPIVSILNMKRHGCGTGTTHIHSPNTHGKTPKPLGLPFKVPGNTHYNINTKPMDHTINITMCVDNAAFGTTYPEQAQEAARILREIAQRIEDDPSKIDPYKCPGFSANDINGNRVAAISTSILDF